MKEHIADLTPDVTFADTPDGRPISIDFAKLATTHTLVAAQTGSGKTILLRRMEEGALATGFPVIVFDTDGDMASLRDAAPNGILIVGGPEGDPDITIEQAIRHLQRIVTARASVVFDIHDLDDTGQTSVVIRVLTAMMRLPKDLHQPYLLAIDEAQRFAPQRGTSKAADAIIDVAKRGRSRGLTMVVAKQRIADLSKKVTSQTTNRIFGHHSDAVDRKRVAEELGVSPREVARLTEFAKGEFLIRGAAFGGPLDKVRVRMPRTGKSGKDHLIEKLSLPIVPVEDLRASLGVRSASEGRGGSLRNKKATMLRPALPLAAGPVGPEDPDESGESMEVGLLEILAKHARGSMAKDSLALLAGSTERRRGFQMTLSTLIGGKLVSLGAGDTVRITVEGRAVVEGARSRTVYERLAILRAAREPNDERVIACLSAAGNVPLQIVELRERTGLGPRVLKAALQRLKRDGWIVPRRGAFTTSPALARLIGRRPTSNS